MISLAIKSLSSPDVEIEAWQPESNDLVYFLLQLEIGEAGDSRADVFQVVVATPEGLRRHATREVVSERATIILSEFSWPALRRCLQRILTTCSAKDWNESVLRLQRYFLWEYEDFIQEGINLVRQ